MKTERQRIIELERQLSNITHDGEVTAIQNNLVKVKVSHGDTESFTTSWLPVLGRTVIESGEPVLVIMPNANPAVGYVIPALPDPKVRELEQQLAQLANQVQQLQQQVSSWNG